MNNLEESYKLIFKEFSKIAVTENFYFKPIKPKLSEF